jgi:hypothetical protein
MDRNAQEREEKKSFFNFNFASERRFEGKFRLFTGKKVMRKSRCITAQKTNEMCWNFPCRTFFFTRAESERKREENEKR